MPTPGAGDDHATGAADERTAGDSTEDPAGDAGGEAVAGVRAVAGSGSPSARAARQKLVSEFVLERGSASATEIAELTGVSVMTVHRDLDELARQGIVRRYRGGASAQPSSVFESNIEFRLRTSQREKQAIARVARSLVEPGMSILLDDATTTLALARVLEGIEPLTVVTNYVGALLALREIPGIRLIGLGGTYSATHDSFNGVGCIEAISSLNVDLSFISVSSMTATMTYHQEQEIVVVKRAEMQAADRSVLLMDSSKTGRRALHRVAPVSDFDILVTDSGMDTETLTELRSGPTRLEVAHL